MQVPACMLHMPSQKLQPCNSLQHWVPLTSHAAPLHTSNIASSDTHDCTLRKSCMKNMYRKSKRSNCGISLQLNHDQQMDALPSASEVFSIHWTMQAAQCCMIERKQCPLLHKALTNIYHHHSCTIFQDDRQQCVAVLLQSRGPTTQRACRHAKTKTAPAISKLRDQQKRGRPTSWLATTTTVAPPTAQSHAGTPGTLCWNTMHVVLLSCLHTCIHDRLPWCDLSMFVKFHVSVTAACCTRQPPFVLHCFAARPAKKKALKRGSKPLCTQ
ncbi:hypothetical protein COO60DRAFT_296608 [Scenedesmus sp. NREL 46B-D3]|nr:hypothetical protein COO60DRAFT_296608 [Scenedesmus sp. NREL 46B-D3]